MVYVCTFWPIAIYDAKALKTKSIKDLLRIK